MGLGLGDIAKQLQDLPQATKEMQESLDHIEKLLHVLVDIQLVNESEALREYIEEKFGITQG